MSTNFSGGQIKGKRLALGFSQQELADMTGLSLRTIQRIENGGTSPRAYSMRKLFEVLEIPLTEKLHPNKNVTTFILTLMHLSALIFFVQPFLGVLLPFIIWLIKKNEIPEVNTSGKRIINFELTLYIIYLLPLFLVLIVKMFQIDLIPAWFNIKAIYVIIYLLNLVVIIVNTIALYFQKSFWYMPVIPFLKARN